MHGRRALRRGDRPALDPSLVARVLAKLGLSERPPIGDSGLAQLYFAWCRAVPCDNVQKRITVARRRRPLAGAHPEEFFESWLRDGTGGTCWPSSGALHALLASLGYDARRVAGNMSPDRWPGEINHGSVIVRVDGRELLVDSSMLTERPLPLRRDGPTRIDDPVHPISATPEGELWRIHWRIQARDREIDCLLTEDDVPLERYLERYEGSRVSGFSYFVTATKNAAAGVVSLNGHTRAFRDRTGALHVTEHVDRERVLVDEIGLSPEVVRALPADEDDPRRPPPASVTA